MLGPFRTRGSVQRTSPGKPGLQVNRSGLLQCGQHRRQRPSWRHRRHLDRVVAGAEVAAPRPMLPLRWHCWSSTLGFQRQSAVVAMANHCRGSIASHHSPCFGTRGRTGRSTGLAPAASVVRGISWSKTGASTLELCGGGGKGIQCRPFRRRLRLRCPSRSTSTNRLAHLVAHCRRHKQIDRRQSPLTHRS